LDHQQSIAVFDISHSPTCGISTKEPPLSNLQPGRTAHTAAASCSRLHIQPCECCICCIMCVMTYNATLHTHTAAASCSRLQQASCVEHSWESIRKERPNIASHATMLGAAAKARCIDVCCTSSRAAVHVDIVPPQPVGCSSVAEVPCSGRPTYATTAAVAATALPPLKSCSTKLQHACAVYSTVQ
jgi:hypothetical protein